MNRTLTCLAGLVLTAASATANATTIDLMTDGGFETTDSPQGSQTSWNSSAYGSWAVGDPLTTVGSQLGVDPLEGSRMLRFGSSGGSSVDLYQIVSVEAWAAEIDAGEATVDIGVSFNAAGPGANAGLRLIGWNFAPTSFNGVQILGDSFEGLFLDGDVNTWESFAVNDIQLNAGIRYIGIGLHEKTANPIAYADLASMTLSVPVPAPPALMLFGLGLMLTGLRRR